MNSAPLFKQLRTSIANNQLDEALSQLQLLLENSPLLNEAIQQAGRFAAIRNQIRLGIVSHAEATLTQDQIRAGLLDLLQEIERQQGTQAAIQTEIEQVATDKTIIQNADKIYNIDHIDEANFS